MEQIEYDHHKAPSTKSWPTSTHHHHNHNVHPTHHQPPQPPPQMPIYPASVIASTSTSTSTCTHLNETINNITNGMTLINNKERIEKMQSMLNKTLGPEFLSQRSGAGGGKLTYIEGWKAINLANEVFGFNGQSALSASFKFTIDFI